MIHEIDLGVVDAPLYRAVQESGPGWSTTRSVPAGKRSGRVVVSIDTKKLLEMARRAIYSTRGKSTALHGAIVATAVGVKELP